MKTIHLLIESLRELLEADCPSGMHFNTKQRRCSQLPPEAASAHHHALSVGTAAQDQSKHAYGQKKPDPKAHADSAAWNEKAYRHHIAAGNKMREMGFDDLSKHHETKAREYGKLAYQHHLGAADAHEQRLAHITPTIEKFKKAGSEHFAKRAEMNAKAISAMVNHHRRQAAQYQSMR